jgi:hypothetical protein
MHCEVRFFFCPFCNAPGTLTRPASTRFFVGLQSHTPVPWNRFCAGRGLWREAGSGHEFNHNIPQRLTLAGLSSLGNLGVNVHADTADVKRLHTHAQRLLCTMATKACDCQRLPAIAVTTSPRPMVAQRFRLTHLARAACTSVMLHSNVAVTASWAGTFSAAR